MHGRTRADTSVRLLSPTGALSRLITFSHEGKPPDHIVFAGRAGFPVCRRQQQQQQQQQPTATATATTREALGCGTSGSAAVDRPGSPVLGWGTSGSAPVERLGSEDLGWGTSGSGDAGSALILFFPLDFFYATFFLIGIPFTPRGPGRRIWVGEHPGPWRSSGHIFS